jgi:hypothetical protein
VKLLLIMVEKYMPSLELYLFQVTIFNINIQAIVDNIKDHYNYFV